MDLTTLALWTQVVSSLAVLGTVIYLAIEIRQNTIALKSQTHSTLFEGAQTEILVLLENPDIVRAMTTDDALSEEDYIKLSAFLTAFLRAREFTWLQFQQGVVGEDSLDTEKTIIKNTINVERNLLWWRNVGKGAFGPGFVVFVDSLIEDGGRPGEWYARSLGWESVTVSDQT
jgi:hypothetical protein